MIKRNFLTLFRCHHRQIIFFANQDLFGELSPNAGFRVRHIGLGVRKNKTMEYAERRLLGYSAEQMFDIVADVKKYREFVPWCTNSALLYKHEGSPPSEKYQLEIGFPPISEKYHSIVTTVRPNLCKSVATEGRLFNYLITEWKFGPGADDNELTCTLDFYVSFEFRNALYSKMSKLFFDEVVKQMVNAFLKRAQKLYGPPSIAVQKTLLVRAVR